MCNDKENKKQNVFKRGLIDGFPIGLVYFAVSFALGIAARNVGMNIIQGFVMSLTTIASAGEYAGISIIGAGGSYMELVILTIVTDIRYILMSCALTQRFDPNMPLLHKIGVGTFITDEIFAIEIAQPGYIKPLYTYGAAAISVPMWSLGTALGIIAGNILPENLLSAFSVALYGMFIGIIIPPAKTDRAILACIGAGFVFSWAGDRLIAFLSPGIRMIAVIVVISALAAVLFPVKEDRDE